MVTHSRNHADRDAALARLKQTPRTLPLSAKIHKLATGPGSTALLFSSPVLFLLAFIGAKNNILEWQKLSNPSTTSGTITNSDYTDLTVNEKPQMVVDFQFNLNGQTYEGYSFGLSPVPGKGQQVTIEYNPDNPQYARVRGLSYARFQVLVYLGTGLFAVCVFIGMLGWRKTAKIIFLMENGRLAIANLKEKKATGLEVNGQMVYKMLFSFKDDQGTTHDIAHKTRFTKAISDEKNEPLLYHPTNPGQFEFVDNLKHSIELENYDRWPGPTTSQLFWATAKLGTTMLMIVFAIRAFLAP